jgi:hypothetical protein
MYDTDVGNADNDGDMVADWVDDGEQDASATGRTDTTKLVMVGEERDRGSKFTRTNGEQDVALGMGDTGRYPIQDTSPSTHVRPQVACI